MDAAILKHGQILQADAAHLPLADKSVDLVFTSPPYVDARWYGDRQKHARNCIQWVDWMLTVVKELTRVAKGLVLINCAGVTRKHRYQPAPEMLLSEWYKLGGECWRPYFWHRVGIPGSGGKQWLRADVEYVLAFKDQPGAIHWADNTACGHPPKWGPGGEMSHRLGDGARVNQWGLVGSAKGMGTKKANGEFGSRERPSHRPKTQMEDSDIASLGGKRHTKRDAGPQANGDALREQVYLPPAKANPGTLFKCVVGGGVMGHKLAHENEAPFPLKLAEFAIKSWCPPGGMVLDPFGGSGTTAHAAYLNGRKFISSDLRQSQCDLMRRRLGDVMSKTGLFAEVA